MPLIRIILQLKKFVKNFRREKKFDSALFLSSRAESAEAKNLADIHFLLKLVENSANLINNICSILKTRNILFH
jgi:hypothetical protein